MEILVENEKKTIAKIKQRQKMEIQAMVEYEVKMEIIRRVNEEKMLKQKEKEAESGGQFLVGHGARLFYVGSDYQIGEAVDGYEAVGCGLAYAKGAMAAMINLVPEIAPKQMIEYALQITERNCAGVRAPFTVVTL